jgi:transketolase
LAVKAQEQLAADGIRARVVSMPCVEWFFEQDEAYRESVLPTDLKARVSVEAGVALGWRTILGDAGRAVSLEHFGASASGSLLFKEFGFTAEKVAEAARESIEAAKSGGSPTHPLTSGPSGTADRMDDSGATIS